ncbi:MAG: hypothetical protein NTV24_01750 [Candidatus Woesebacteria bacterium]|nr:hypothetical protein [Candidatus Woesebacteria bacterium]
MDNQYLEKDIKELLEESFLLLKLFEEESGKFKDYSFVVFPAAKAYEGFLKKLFLDNGFITQDDYYGKRFRIGKALNPYLEKEIREESVYDKIVAHCGGKRLANFFWETWKECRNTVFHWFPNEKNIVTLPEAGAKLEMIVKAIDEAYKECNTR